MNRRQRRHNQQVAATALLFAVLPFLIFAIMVIVKGLQP